MVLRQGSCSLQHVLDALVGDVLHAVVVAVDVSLHPVLLHQRDQTEDEVLVLVTVRINYERLKSSQK